MPYYLFYYTLLHSPFLFITYSFSSWFFPTPTPPLLSITYIFVGSIPFHLFPFFIPILVPLPLPLFHGSLPIYNFLLLPVFAVTILIRICTWRPPGFTFPALLLPVFNIFYIIITLPFSVHPVLYLSPYLFSNALYLDTCRALPCYLGAFPLNVVTVWHSFLRCHGGWFWRVLVLDILAACAALRFCVLLRWRRRTTERKENRCYDTTRFGEKFPSVHSSPFFWLLVLTYYAAWHACAPLVHFSLLFRYAAHFGACSIHTGSLPLPCSYRFGQALTVYYLPAPHTCAYHYFRSFTFTPRTAFAHFMPWWLTTGGFGGGFVDVGHFCVPCCCCARLPTYLRLFYFSYPIHTTHTAHHTVPSVGGLGDDFFLHFQLLEFTVYHFSFYCTHYGSILFTFFVVYAFCFRRILFNPFLLHTPTYPPTSFGVFYSQFDPLPPPHIPTTPYPFYFYFTLDALDFYVWLPLHIFPIPALPPTTPIPDVPRTHWIYVRFCLPLPFALCPLCRTVFGPIPHLLRSHTPPPHYPTS